VTVLDVKALRLLAVAGEMQLAVGEYAVNIEQQTADLF
jgi:hypothetical protein